MTIRRRVFFALFGAALALSLALRREPQAGEPKLALLLELVAFIAVSFLLEAIKPKPKIEEGRPPKLDFPTSDAGRVIPLVCGTDIVESPDLCWWGDSRQDAITKRVSTGFFSRQRILIGYFYFASLHLGLCRAIARGTLRMVEFYVGDKLLSSATVIGGGRLDIVDQSFQDAENDTGGFAASVDFFDGDLTQPASVFLDTVDRLRVTTAATPTAPAYRGTCYIVVRQLTFADATATNKGAFLGNSPNIQPIKVTLQEELPLFTGQSAGQNLIGGLDANPINWIYTVLTDIEWGMKQADSMIDLGTSGSFKKASDACIAEGNGFSMTFETITPNEEKLKEALRQIDGVLFVHPATGKWTISLARESNHANFGWDIDTVLQLTDDDVIAIDDYKPGEWASTLTDLEVAYRNRADAYRRSFAPAKNMANSIMLADGSIAAPVRNGGVLEFPGIRTSSLANQVAHRELRARSTPLISVSLKATRKAWSVALNDVVAWTSTRYGHTKLAMRVLNVDYGTLGSDSIGLTLVQAIGFGFQPGLFGDPADSGWEPPGVTLGAFPADEQLAIEAPRGLVVRDPDFSGNPYDGKILVSARRQENELGFRATQRNPSGSGGYSEAGDTLTFARIGSLTSSLAVGSAYPLATLTVTPGPDSQTAIEEVFDDATTIGDLGSKLVQLIYVGGEFMLVQSAANSGGNVNLQNVYRGVLGTAQIAHSAGEDVWLLFVGADMASTILSNTTSVDVQLRQKSSEDVYAGSVTTITFTLAKKAMRPYPPSAVFYNGSGTPFGAPNMEGDGSGLNGVGFDIDWRRRRFDVADEIAELLADQSVDASTEYRVRVYVDPTGADVLAFDSGWVSGSGPETPTQAEIVNEDAAGTALRVNIAVRHDVEAEVDLEGHHELDHVVTPTSPRTTQFWIGGDLSSGVTSIAYTAMMSTTHTVTIGASYSTATVEANIDGGGWSLLIGTGATSNTIALTSGEMLELRVTANEAPARNFVEINDGTNDVAYGVFTNGT